jgi:hypothetical protein
VKESKVKLNSYFCTGAKKERKYSSNSFLTSLDCNQSSASRPGRVLPPGMDHRYPLHWRLGGPQRCSEHRGYRKKKSFARNRTPVVQSVVRSFSSFLTRRFQKMTAVKLSWHIVRLESHKRLRKTFPVPSFLLFWTGVSPAQYQAFYILLGTPLCRY